jgi:hypothetical protein
MPTEIILKSARNHPITNMEEFLKYKYQTLKNMIVPFNNNNSG